MMNSLSRLDWNEFAYPVSLKYNFNFIKSLKKVASTYAGHLQVLGMAKRTPKPQFRCSYACIGIPA